MTKTREFPDGLHAAEVIRFSKGLRLFTNDGCTSAVKGPDDQCPPGFHHEYRNSVCIYCKGNRSDLRSCVGCGKPGGNCPPAKCGLPWCQCYHD
jgi:hypothetical protein